MFLLIQNYGYLNWGKVVFYFLEEFLCIDFAKQISILYNQSYQENKLVLIVFVYFEAPL